MLLTVGKKLNQRVFIQSSPLGSLNSNILKLFQIQLELYNKSEDPSRNDMMIAQALSVTESV